MKKLLIRTAAFFLLLSFSFLCFSCDDDDAEVEYPLEILSFRIDNNPLVVNQPELLYGIDNTYSFDVVAETTPEDLKTITPAIIVSPNCVVTPATGETVDFSGGSVEYTVESGITGESRKYTVQCVRNKFTDALILSVYFEDEIITNRNDIEIPQDGDDVVIYVPFGTDDDALAALTPHFELSAGATINPESGAVQDFSSRNVAYTVTAEEGGTKTNTYNLIIKEEANTDSRILSLNFEEAAQLGIEFKEINHQSREIFFNAQPETDLSNLTVAIEISPEATVVPANGEKVDFSGGSKEFTVTAGDGSETVYTVYIQYAIHPSATMTSFRLTDDGLIVGESPIIIENQRVSFTVAPEADVTALYPVLEVSNGAKVFVKKGAVETQMPIDGSQPVDFSDKQNGVTFVVKSASGTYWTEYTFICTRLLATEAALLSVSFAGETVIESALQEIEPETIDGKTVRAFEFWVDIDATLQQIGALEPIIEVSPGATVVKETANDIFAPSDYVTYVITSEDGETVSRFKVYCKWRKIVYDFEEWEKVTQGTLGTKTSWDPAPTSWWATSNAGIGSIPSGSYAWCIQQSTDVKNSGYYAVSISSRYTKGGNLFGQKWPALTAGSLYIGDFKVDWGDKLKSAKFGKPFGYKPTTVRGYYKYKPGTTYYRCDDPIDNPNKAVVDNALTDECSFEVVLFIAGEGEDAYLYGTNLQDNTERIIARASLENRSETPGDGLHYFELPLTYLREYVPNDNIKFAIVMSSSRKGDLFSGAADSCLIVDDIEVIYER